MSNRLINAIINRYQDPGTDKISFEDFMLCMVRLKTAFETIEAHPKNLEGTSLFSAEDVSYRILSFFKGKLVVFFHIHRIVVIQISSKSLIEPICQTNNVILVHNNSPILYI